MEKPKEIKLPIRFDKLGGYFWDANNHMIAMMRGWGWIQYRENPEDLQDSIGEWMAEKINSDPVKCNHKNCSIHGMYEGEQCQKCVEMTQV